MSGVIQTPLLTHSTNPRSLNFVGLDNPDHNSGVNMGVLYGAGTAQADVTLKINQVVDGLISILCQAIFNHATLKAKTGLKLAAGVEQQIFPFFPVPLV